MDALRDRDNDIVCGLKQFYREGKRPCRKPLPAGRSSAEQWNIHFSQARTAVGKAGIPSHDLDDRDTFTA